MKKKAGKSKKQKVLIIIVASIVALLLFGYFVPLSSHQYVPQDPDLYSGLSFPDTNKLQVTRYLFAIEIKIPVGHGACDRLKASSTLKDGVRVVTFQTTSTVSPSQNTCSALYIPGPTEAKVFALPWQRSFIIKDNDRVMYSGKL